MTYCRTADDVGAGFGTMGATGNVTDRKMTISAAWDAAESEVI
eukprot:CAMPEP_0184398014 /NCGR_PEP_ID=MMETSP0007-20130409/63629_1 /TAXON_ID=97485 /ORGANISM="Prymnesium parvum, Strain Texoma1" /LENGTH=42 /DNA_ID= /DNA_START= /DNA_END= /DNA_ORIENTATION=